MLNTFDKIGASFLILKNLKWINNLVYMSIDISNLGLSQKLGSF